MTSPPRASNRCFLRSRFIAICLAGMFAAPGALAADFTDVTASAGVDYLQYQIPAPLVANGPEFMNGGAAVGDYDGDGLPDLFVTRGDDTDILFRNNGDGTFTDVTASAGLDQINANTNGAAFGDIDNDGDQDLFVTAQCEVPCLAPYNTRHFLFINDGFGSFTEEGTLRGADVAGTGPHYGYSVAFGDYDLDGYLDIHVNEWRRDVFNPLSQPSNARLLRNRGAQQPGYFDDVTVPAGVEMDNVPLLFGVQGTTTFSSTFSDMDGDGWPDLLIAADFGSSRIFWNNGDGTFTDGTLAAGVGGDENGMGSAIGDYDGDGLLDWFVTSIYDPLDQCQCDNGLTGNRLYRNLGNRTFSDETDAVGVRDGGWGWAALFLDYDNDGDLDLTMNNGQDWPDPMVPGADFFMNDQIRFWRNDAGSMTEIAAASGLTLTGSGKGALSFDYDQDGDLDLFYTTNSGHPVLYRNDVGNQNDWLRVEARGVGSNRDGVGVRVEVLAGPGGPSQLREIQSGSHFLGQSERVAHFGLGPGPGGPVDVEVTWPRTGRTILYQNVSRNSVLVATEPDDAPTSVSLTADKSSPQTLASVGVVTFTAAATGGTGPYEYQFWVRDPTLTWSMVQGYSSSDSISRSLDSVGTWVIVVFARNQGSTAPFEVVQLMVFEVVNNAPVASVSLTGNPPSPQSISAGSVTFTAVATGGTGTYEYQFWARIPAGTWVVVQDYSTSDSITDSPAFVGDWIFVVFARNQGSSAASEAANFLPYTVTP